MLKCVKEENHRLSLINHRHRPQNPIDIKKVLMCKDKGTELICPSNT